MIQRDVGDGGDFGNDHVGRVEASAEPHFDARAGDLLLGEHDQGEKRAGLEQGHSQISRQRPQATGAPPRGEPTARGAPSTMMRSLKEHRWGDV